MWHNKRKGIGGLSERGIYPNCSLAVCQSRLAISLKAITKFSRSLCLATMSSTEYTYQSLKSQNPKTSCYEKLSCPGCSAGSDSSGRRGDEGHKMFRLLTLHPGLPGSVISCELEVVPICMSQPYEALSYVWGDPTVTKEIVLQGSPFRITTNLESALQHLRFADTARCLWVDAICIDQTNLKERSEQVQMMAEIYYGATRVLAWLGEADVYTEPAFDAVEQLCSLAKYRIWRYCSLKSGVQMKELNDDIVGRFIMAEGSEDDSLFHLYWIFPRRMESLSTHLRRTQSILCNSADATTETSLRTLERYFSVAILHPQDIQDIERSMVAVFSVFRSRSWWKRIWVIQEALCAKDVLIICGTRETLFGSLDLAFLGISEEKLSHGGQIEFERDLASFMSNALDLFTRRVTTLRLEDIPKGPLHDLLASFWNHECRDPCDKIFALLSLVESPALTVDYTKAEVEVYVEATRSIILSNKSLPISCMILESGPRMDVLVERGLPTWVPDFSKRLALDQLVWLQHDLKHQLYGAISKSVPHDAVSVENSLIPKLYAIFCDTIDIVRGRIYDWSEWGEGREGKKKIAQWIPARKLHYPTGEALLDAFCRTLLQDRYEESHGTASYWLKERTNRLNRKLLRKLLMLSCGVTDEDCSYEDANTNLLGRYPYTVSRFEEVLGRRVLRKTFYITARSYFGMVGGDVQGLCRSRLSGPAHTSPIGR